ncbi:MAG: FtsH protease activity modulator HflK [Magnetococcales bacterium]|nr:FtsH protease activity modulator HflK [Magnetococcales bacterium]
MSWNDSGGGPQGPWGSGNMPPQPPDIEKIVEMLREKMAGNVPGGKAWPMLLGVAFVLWMATGIYLVAPDEKGVVVRFGRYVETTDSGPHFHLPYPIETVYTPKVTQVQRVEIGYRTRGRSTVTVAEESLMLTGDENIIDINLSVQYRIEESGAANYLFNLRNPSSDPHMIVRDVTEASIRQVIGRNSIDTALTTGKEKIQADTKQTMQAILDGYRSGLRIIAVQLQQVAPPEEVIHAFKDVASAREDRERAINEAEGYANDILPKAKGEAAKQVQEAEAYKAAKLTKAEGDVHRFLSLLNEYNKAKEVTRTRLYLETMEKILPDMNKIFVQSGGSQAVLPYLPLPGNRNAPSAEKGAAQ